MGCPSANGDASRSAPFDRAGELNSQEISRPTQATQRVEAATPVFHGAGRPLAQVTAVVLCRDGTYLQRTLAAVGAQTRRPDVVVAVDSRSGLVGPDILVRTGLPVMYLPHGVSLGDAVTAALAALDAARLPQQGDPQRVAPAAPPDPVPRWIWLLPDDCAPAPDALERLLEAVDVGPSIAVAGCKRVAWDDPARLVDVGFTTSRFGTVVTGVDAGDVDQGQLDHRCDVLAVSTAGMLARRDVWDALGGSDPALAGARDDLDLCRRAHRAGHRVVVVPSALVAQAPVAGAGPAGSATATATAIRPVSWWLRDRRDAVHLRLAATPRPLLPLALLATALACLLRTVALLVVRQPDRAIAEVVAYAAAVARPAAWLLRPRRRRQLPGRVYRRLLAGHRHAWRQHRDALAGFLAARERARVEAALPVPTPSSMPALLPMPAARPATAAAATAVVPAVPAPRAAGEPVRAPAPPVPGPSARAVALGLTLATTIAAVTGLRSLLGGDGAVTGPALPPLPEAAADLWGSATSSWRPVGLGTAAAPDPLVTGVAGAARLLGGGTGPVIDLLLFGAVPAAAIGAWWAAGAVTRSRSLRAWAALVWAAAPSLLLALAGGRIGAVVAHVALPYAALALAGAVTPAGRAIFAAGRDRTRRRPAGRRPGGSLAGAAAAGLLITVVLAGAPALAVPAAIVLAVVAALAGVRRGVLAWTALIPVVLLLPWWRAVAAAPRLLLAEPGGPGGPPPAAPWWHLTGLPVDPAALAGTSAGAVARLPLALLGLPADHAGWVLRAAAVALAVPVLLAAATGLARRGRRRRVAVAGWAAALAGLAVAVLEPRLSAGAGPDGPLHGWPGPGLSLFCLGVTAAVLCRADGVATRLRRRTVDGRHVVAVVAGLVVVTGPVLTLVLWSWQGGATGVPLGDAPAARVHRADPDVLPAVAVAEAEGPAATRTLVLHVTRKGVRWTVARSGGTRFGDTSAALALRRPEGRADAEVRAAVGGLLSDAGRDERGRLADLGIGSVLLLPPVDDATALALDGARGLVRVAAPAGAVLWRVELAGSGAAPSRPARVRVLAGTGQALAALPSDGSRVDAELPAGPAGRRLVLAERADAGWHATLGGRPLRPAVHAGWAQAFDLPPTGGRLVVEHGTGGGTTDLLRVAVAALALLIAVPLPRRRERTRQTPAAPWPGPDTQPVPIVRPAARRAGEPPPEGAAGPFRPVEPFLPVESVEPVAPVAPVEPDDVPLTPVAQPLEPMAESSAEPVLDAHAGPETDPALAIAADIAVDIAADTTGPDPADPDPADPDPDPDPDTAEPDADVIVLEPLLPSPRSPMDAGDER